MPKPAMSSQILGKVTVINDQEIKWEIENFLSHKDKDECFPSPEFCISGTQWCLKIWPKNFPMFVPLYLTGKAFEKPKGVIYNYGFHKADGSVEKQKEACWVFDENSTECWYPHLYDGPEVQNRESQLVPSGILTVTLNFSLMTESLDSFSRWDSKAANLLDMFTSKKDCDVTLKVTSSWISDWHNLKENPHSERKKKSKEIAAHKSVLADRCPQLAAKFEETNFINIEDHDPEEFKIFLRCLYSGSIEGFSDDILKVYHVACAFGPDELKMICKFSIMAHLSIENICDAIFANQSHDYDLQDKMDGFLKANYDEIILTRKWKWLKNTDARFVSHLLQRIGKKKRVCC